ncbi:MAG: radical SAM protein [Planctomycetes bacterium]|nr:radical SAM protein [Planctomycetota bacterium]
MSLFLHFRNVRHAIFQTTRACNLSCSYCYANSAPMAGHRMSPETFRKGVDLLLAPSVSDQVTIQFHGGEPLLLPQEWYDEAVSYARRVLSREGRVLRFFLQTNATLATSERIAPLAGLGIRFSTSSDGPPAIADALRGKGAEVMRGRRVLEAFQEGSVGVVTVLTPANCPRIDEVLDYFEAEGVRDFETVLLYRFGRAEGLETRTSAALVFEARKRILDRMIQSRGEGLLDRTVAEYVLSYVFGRRKDRPENRSCGSFFCGAGTSVVAVSWDGGVYPCHKSIEEPRWRLLDLAAPGDGGENANWTAGLDSYHHKGSFWFDCDSCPARTICTYSCSAFYVDGSGDEARECAFTKLFHRHLVEREAEVRELALALAARRRPVTVENPGDAEPVDPERVLAGLSHLAEFARDPGRRVLGWSSRGHVVEIAGRTYLLASGPTRVLEIAPAVARALRAEGAGNPEAAQRELAAEVGDREALAAWVALPPVPAGSRAG